MANYVASSLNPSLTPHHLRTLSKLSKMIFRAIPCQALSHTQVRSSIPLPHIPLIHSRRGFWNLPPALRFWLRSCWLCTFGRFFFFFLTSLSPHFLICKIGLLRIEWDSVHEVLPTVHDPEYVPGGFGLMWSLLQWSGQAGLSSQISHKPLSPAFIKTMWQHLPAQIFLFDQTAYLTVWPWVA